MRDPSPNSVRARFRALLADLERPLLAFPVAVIVLVGATFLFPGGRCGAWQWWTAVAGTAVWAFLRSGGRRRGGAVVIGFLAVLALLALATDVMLASAKYDMLRCHVPAVRMLSEGWNPVWQGSFAGLRSATGVELDSVFSHHILAATKGVWYFDAAAWFFLRNPWNPMFALTPLLLVVCALVLTDVFSSASVAWRLAGFSLVACLMPGLGDPVDAAITLESLGLMMAMYDWLRRERWNGFRLFSFTVLMAVSKTTGILHAVLFWLAFGTVAAVWRNRAILRASVKVLATAVFPVAIVCTSPYLSSWVAFGHPFYPYCTGDAERFPAKDITSDFRNRNEDAEAMGHAGAWLNAFVSPRLLHAYYRMRTGREDFFPDSITWLQKMHTEGSPTSLPFRVLFCSMMVLLVLRGRRAGVFVALCLVAGTLAVPTPMIGYLRYTPWVPCTALFCMPALLFRRPPGLPRWVRAPVPCMLAVVLAMPPMLRLAYAADDAYAILALERRGPGPAFAVPVDLELGWAASTGLPDSALYGNLQLLRRQSAWFAKTVVLNGAADRRVPENWRGQPFERFPCNGFAVSPDCPVSACSAHQRLFDLPTRHERLMATPCFVLETFCVRLPASCWMALVRRFG